MVVKIAKIKPKEPLNFKSLVSSPTQDPYAFLEQLDNDTLWKFCSDCIMDVIAEFALKGKVHGLDFNRIEFLNKELQNIMMEDVSHAKGFVDKLIKIYKTRWPDKYVILHLEFQTEARPEFSRRTAYYKIGLRLNHRDCVIITITIIHRASKSYIHGHHRFGSARNGESVDFEGYIIAAMEEDNFADKNCVVSQLFNSIWLYEHRRQYSKDELLKKFIEIAKNVISYGFVGKRHYSILLFVYKYALKCLTYREIFRTFTEQIALIDKINNPMTVVEQYIQHVRTEGRSEGWTEGRSEGRSEGRAEGWAESLIEFAKKLINEKLPLEFVKKLTGLDIQQLKEIKESI